MARLAKATQAAFDELDRPCAAVDIKRRFMPSVHVALGTFPRACGDSVEHAAVTLAERHSNREIPTGYGAALLRHFCRRSEQLKPIGKVPIEYRFALIELTVVASIAGGWADSLLRRVTVAGHRELVCQVLRAASATPAARIAHVEQWRRVLVFQLDSPGFSSFVLRNLAYALLWCGCFSPDNPVMTDRYIARQFFDVDRAKFVRCRQEALRLLAMLLEFSLLPPAGVST